MKTKTIYVLIAVILLVVIAIAIAKRLTNTEKKEKEEKEEQQNSSGGSDSSGSSNLDTTLTQNATFPLQLTSPMKKGKNVRQLQNWLNRKKSPLYAPITVDGIFGAKTENLLLAVTGKKSMTELEFTNKGVYQETIL
jgi:type III secretory pathway component EscV